MYQWHFENWSFYIDRFDFLFGFRTWRGNKIAFFFGPFSAYYGLGRNKISKGA